MHAQERFLDCFDPDGYGGFVYRANTQSPGVSVTAEERARMVAIDDDRRGVATILYVIDLPLMMAVGAILDVNPITKPWAPAAAWLILLGLPMAAATWVSMAPDRVVRGRPHIDQGLPRVEAARWSVRQWSWPSLILTAVGGVIPGFGLADWTGSNMGLRALGVFFVLFSIFAFAEEAKIMLRMRAEDRRARGDGP